MVELEKRVCNLPLIFTEVFKDEINANDEQKLYTGIKKIIGKYSANEMAMTAINDFTSAISGGSSLMEIIQISLEEATNPSLSSDISVDDSCKRN
jgi:hypothetical protein